MSGDNTPLTPDTGEDVGRRGMFAALLGLAAASVATGCASSTDEGEKLKAISQAFSGSGTLLYADSIGTDTMTPKDLRNLTGALGQIAVATGFWGPADGGGGVFYWDALSTLADNQGTTIKPTAVSGAGRWRRIYSGEVRVGWFGGNLANAFAAALNVATATGGTVIVDCNIAVTGPLTVPGNVTLRILAGSIITINAGATLTIDGRLEAGFHTIFSLVGANATVLVNTATSGASCHYLFPEWWGARADGSTDCTSALQQATDCSDRSNNRPILLAGRKYKITGTITSKLGALFIGAGQVGASAEYCTTIYHAGNGDLFVWDAGASGFGAVPSNAAVGGGLINLHLIKAAANFGGTAIFMIARDDAHRPSDFRFDNVVIEAEAAANPWYQIMHIDGKACFTANNPGIRDVRINKLRCAHASDAYRYIWLEQVVHFHASCLQIDPAGAADAGLTLSNGCSDIYLHAADVSGKLIVDSSVGQVYPSQVPTQICVLGISGKFLKAFIVNTAYVSGVVMVETAQINRDVAGSGGGVGLKIIGGTTSERMRARLSTPVSNKTGAGTAYQVMWDGTDWDDNHQFIGPAFKCASQQVYRFESFVELTNLQASHNKAAVSIVRNGAVAFTVLTNPWNLVPAGTTSAQVGISHVMACQPDDLVRVDVTVFNGSTATVGVGGSSWFSAKADS